MSSLDHNLSQANTQFEPVFYSHAHFHNKICVPHPSLFVLAVSSTKLPALSLCYCAFIASIKKSGERGKKREKNLAQQKRIVNEKSSHINQQTYTL